VLGAAVVLLAGLGSLHGSAEAAGARVCNGAGSFIFDVHEDGSASITASGGGACTVNLGSQLKLVSLSGTGSASSLGLCSGDLVAQTVHLSVTVTAVDPFTGATDVEHYDWSMPVTTYPVATPIIIRGDHVGASLMLNHLFLSCGQDGRRPTANFNWVQTS
jgi:hypothetical protein